MKTSLFIGLIMLTLFFACQETESERLESSPADSSKFNKTYKDSLILDGREPPPACPPFCE